MNRAITKVGCLLLDYATVLVLIVGMGCWQFLTKTPLTVRTELTLTGFCVVLTLLDAVRKIHAYASVAPVEKKEKRVFVEDPEVVLELARLTGYDAIGRFTPYLGKWMMISGTYEGLAKSLRRDSIHLSILLNDGRRINLRFAVDGEERFRGLQVGQRITAVCQIQHRNFTFTPENCELIRADSLRRTERSVLANAS